MQTNEVLNRISVPLQYFKPYNYVQKIINIK